MPQVATMHDFEFPNLDDLDDDEADEYTEAQGSHPGYLSYSQGSLENLDAEGNPLDIESMFVEEEVDELAAAYGRFQQQLGDLADVKPTRSTSVLAYLGGILKTSEEAEGLQAGWLNQEEFEEKLKGFEKAMTELSSRLAPEEMQAMDDFDVLEQSSEMTIADALLNFQFPEEQTEEDIDHRDPDQQALDEQEQEISDDEQEIEEGDGDEDEDDFDMDLDDDYDEPDGFFSQLVDELEGNLDDDSELNGLLADLHGRIDWEEIPEAGALIDHGLTVSFYSNGLESVSGEGFVELPKDIFEDGVTRITNAMSTPGADQDVQFLQYETPAGETKSMSVWMDHQDQTGERLMMYAINGDMRSFSTNLGRSPMRSIDERDQALGQPTVLDPNSLESSNPDEDPQYAPTNLLEQTKESAPAAFEWQNQLREGPDVNGLQQNQPITDKAEAATSKDIAKPTDPEPAKEEQKADPRLEEAQQRAIEKARLADQRRGRERGPTQTTQGFQQIQDSERSSRFRSSVSASQDSDSSNTADGGNTNNNTATNTGTSGNNTNTNTSGSTNTDSAKGNTANTGKASDNKASNNSATNTTTTDSDTTAKTGQQKELRFSGAKDNDPRSQSRNPLNKRELEEVDKETRGRRVRDQQSSDKQLQVEDDLQAKAEKDLTDTLSKDKALDSGPTIKGPSFSSGPAPSSPPQGGTGTGPTITSNPSPSQSLGAQGTTAQPTNQNQAQPTIPQGTKPSGPDSTAKPDQAGKTPPQQKAPTETAKPDQQSQVRQGKEQEGQEQAKANTLQAKGQAEAQAKIEQDKQPTPLANADQSKRQVEAQPKGQEPQDQEKQIENQPKDQTEAQAKIEQAQKDAEAKDATRQQLVDDKKLAAQQDKILSEQQDRGEQGKESLGQPIDAQAQERVDGQQGKEPSAQEVAPQPQAKLDSQQLQDSAQQLQQGSAEALQEQEKSNYDKVVMDQAADKAEQKDQARTTLVEQKLEQNSIEPSQSDQQLDKQVNVDAAKQGGQAGSSNDGKQLQQEQNSPDSLKLTALEKNNNGQLGKGDENNKSARDERLGNRNTSQERADVKSSQELQQKAQVAKEEALKVEREKAKEDERYYQEQNQKRGRWRGDIER